ncbi:MAG: hypothetical protein NTU73_00550 [Ignavibacteriae bacterium]|nr:hypothetical protein [Ignavibacteriota bacterium]
MCNKNTYEECLEKKLFGNKFYKKKVERIIPKDIFFLHNYDDNTIEGPFYAVSNGQENIDKNAWGGRFPYQVRIKPKNNTVKFTLDAFKKFGVEYQTGFMDHFTFEIPEYIGKELMKNIGQIKFQDDKKEYEIIDTGITDTDIRLKYPAKYRTDDGHYVRSKNEVIVDNWLYRNYVTHCYEKLVPGEKMLSDFFIKKDNIEVYIEVWGLDDPAYKNRKNEKINIYKNKSLKLINLDENCIMNIDDIMTKEMKKFGLL